MENYSLFDSFIFSIIIWAVCFFIGTLELLSHTFYRPWKLKKMLNSSPFMEFRRKGFKKDGNEYKGSARGYNVLIGILWENYQKQPTYYVQILFNPFSFGRFLRKDEYDKFDRELMKEKKMISLNSVIMEYNRYKGFNKLKFDFILEDIFKVIDFLKFRKLTPIDEIAWEAMIPELEKHEETFIY